MKLLIDSREPGQVQQQMIVEAETSDIITDTEVTTLETGDFAVPELGLGIERKEASDYASSVTDGRASRQGDRMVEEYRHRFVVLEGSGLYDLKYSSVSSNSLVGQQVSMAVKRGINFINTGGVKGTCFAVRRIVERLAKQEAGDGEEIGYVKTFDTDADDFRVKALAQVEGISESKAEDLVEQTSLFNDGFSRFGSLLWSGETGDVREELMRVDGVGNGLAERIIKAFT